MSNQQSGKVQRWQRKRQSAVKLMSERKEALLVGETREYSDQIKGLPIRWNLRKWEWNSDLWRQGLERNTP